MTAWNRDHFWEAIPSVASSMNVGRWLRPTAMRGFVLGRVLVAADDHYLKVVADLDDPSFIRFVAALRNARAQYSASADLFGVLGVPAFIGLLAIVQFSSAKMGALITLFGILALYITLYIYYRLMLAQIEACLSVVELDPRGTASLRLDW